MTSTKPNDDAASAASGLDPVHPARPPGTAAAAETTRPTTTTSRTSTTNPSSATNAVGTAGTAGPRLAAGCGTAAVLDHHVVALEITATTRPLIVHTAEGDRDFAPLEAHVWARAGRMTVIAEDGAETRFVILGPEECAALRLGDRWPVGESESLARRLATAAVRDVGEMLTFPAWLARTTRLSGQRNAALYALVKRLRKASPGTAVHYGQTFGLEHHRPEHQHPYDHRGIVGREGYPKELRERYPREL